MFKYFITFFALCSLSIQVFAVEFVDPPDKPVKQADLTWEGSTLYEDSSDLLPQNIASYVIGYGLVSDMSEAEEVNVGNVLTWSTAGFQKGHYHFGVAVIDIHGMRSAWSEIVDIHLLPPSRPGKPKWKPQQVGGVQHHYKRRFRT